MIFQKVGGESVIVLIMIDIVVYGLFVLFYLPSLLLEGDYKLIRSVLGGVLGSRPWWYFPFAVLTLGLGPIIWYWAKVDPVLLAISKSGKR